MSLYATVSVLVVTLMFCINITFLGRYRILRKDSIFVLSFAAIVVAVSFPIILNAFIRAGTYLSFNFALATSIITCFVLIIIFSLIVIRVEYIGKNSNVIFVWDKSVLIHGIEKISYFKKFINNENTGHIKGKKHELPIEGKNIVEKSVDTEQNIDTMGIETFNSESFFLDKNIAIQKNNEAEDNCSFDINNPSMSSNNDRRDNTKNLENDSFVDDYEVHVDYFEEEVLNRFLYYENEYGVEINRTAGNFGECFVVSTCNHSGSVGLGQEYINAQYDDEYLDNTLDNTLDIVLDLFLERQDEVYTNCGSDYLTIEKNNAIDEVFDLVDAHKDTFVDKPQLVDIETLHFNFEKSVDKIIDEAFNLKEKGDYEGAIINFFYALDSKPSDDVVFWIVLDICVMYKQLGQVELAKEVLASYISQYGDLMDETVRYEIELNLQ